MSTKPEIRGARRRFSMARERSSPQSRQGAWLGPNPASSTVEELEQRTLLSNTFTVTNLNDSGPGSLRQAIASANGGVATGADPIVTWNAIALQAAVDGKTGFIEMRDDAMVHLAQYDAVDSIEQRYAEYSKYGTFLPNAAGADETAAANQAAYAVLSNLLPVDQAKYDAALTTALAAIPDGPAKTAGIALGNAAAARVLALRAGDHAFDVVPYTPGTAPGDWQPTANGLAAQNTQWPFITPFTMQSGAQFRGTLPGPPALNSQAFADAVNEVINLGSPNSTTRTADQSNIAKFWFVLVPRLWNVAAAQVEQSHPLNLLDSARLFALLNMASADDAIASNDSKYFFNFWRPETAIRLANTTGHSNSYSNPAIQGDPNWLPFLPTPAFPSYVSNHASLDGAAAEVMRSVFGTDNISFSLPNTSAFAGVPARSFTSFSQAAVEGALSRIYAGIHYPFDSSDGLMLGQEVGSYVDAHEFAPIQATINFAPRLHGTIGLTSGPLVVTGDVAINGPGAYRITVSGNDSSGVFRNVGPHGEMDISGIAIADGTASGGGGVDNQGGTASLTNVVLFRNTAIGSPNGDARGGGVYNEAGGTLTVTNSFVLGNQARGTSGGGNAAGGGIYNLGTLTVSNTDFLGNLALGGAGADGAAGGWAQGGGIANGAGATGTFSNVLIARNASIGGQGGEGGAGGNGLGGGIADAGSLSLRNTIVSDNSAIGGEGDDGAGGNGLGGGIYIGTNGAVTLNSAVITRNRAEEGDGDEAPDGSGIGGGIYNLGTLSIDMASVIRRNRASTAADDIFG